MLLQTETERVAHLLRRFGFGASEAELDVYVQLGYEGALDRLLEASDDLGAAPVPEDFANAKQRLNMRGVQAWWISRLLLTRAPLRHKVTLFWHDHFATSASKVMAPPLMLQHVQTLHQGALGAFSTLLESVSKDPAMLFWLDGQDNVAGKPNENFGRELLELFTLGIGNYDENDVKDVARAFTGYSFQRQKDGPPAFRFRPRLHDAGEKTILGSSGAWSGEDVISLLASRPETAEFITTKFWAWFAGDAPITDAALRKLAREWQDSGMVTSRLVRAVALRDEFLRPRSLVKNPVDFVIPTLRALGLPELVARGQQPAKIMQALARPVMLATKSMGMELLFPPDVAGWSIGEGWIGTASMMQRIGWADKLISMRGSQASLLAVMGASPSAEQIVERLLSLFDSSLPAEKRQVMAEAAKARLAADPSRTGLVEAVQAATRLLFGSPEFQFE